MSHHADYPLDPRLDITDVYCFTGTLGTVIHPSTVLVMNVAPLQSRGWNPDGYYEFRVDTTSPLDYIEDITWRVTFAADGNAFFADKPPQVSESEFAGRLSQSAQIVRDGRIDTVINGEGLGKSDAPLDVIRDRNIASGQTGEKPTWEHQEQSLDCAERR